MVASTKDHRGAVNAIMVAPRTGGEAISAGSDGCCIIWDLSGGGAKRRASFQSNTFFKSVAYHPDESQVRRPPQLACVGGAPRARPGVMWWRCHRWTAPAGGGEGRPEGSVRVLWAWARLRAVARCVWLGQGGPAAGRCTQAPRVVRAGSDHRHGPQDYLLGRVRRQRCARRGRERGRGHVRRRRRCRRRRHRLWRRPQARAGTAAARPLRAACIIAACTHPCALWRPSRVACG